MSVIENMVPARLQMEEVLIQADDRQEYQEWAEREEREEKTLADSIRSRT